ncbi:hypothetical protein B0H17DRAFT_8574 [Mycena rosella]|uniref:Uncharacterized protein n=1 Tax=Mycena rosella TaxID=1033263 RepID=A0AAD7GSL7_MYCRO|nr:hypothetical protein B0H17DRAFT_8574 [Mycena rosella]
MLTSPTDKPLSEQYAFGGYLNSQTSDSQVFGFSQSRANNFKSKTTSAPHRDLADDTYEEDYEDPYSQGYSQDDTSGPGSEYYEAMTLRSSLKYNLARSGFDLEPEPEPEPERLDSEPAIPPPSPTSEDPTPLATPPSLSDPTPPVSRLEKRKQVHFAPLRQSVDHRQLAALLWGPSFANHQDSADFPILNKSGGSHIRAAVLSHVQPASEEEANIIEQFYNACWNLKPPDFEQDEHYIAKRNDPNPLQREMIRLFVRLSSYMPLMMQTLMEPSQAKPMLRTLESVQLIIEGMQLLARVQDRAIKEL